VRAALVRPKNGHDAWNARTVRVVDEVTMLDACITGKLLTAAHRENTSAAWDHLGHGRSTYRQDLRELLHT